MSSSSARRTASSCCRARSVCCCCAASWCCASEASTAASCAFASGMRPVLLWRRRFFRSRRRRAVSAALTVSSPVVTRLASRFSSASSALTASPSCRTKALRSKTLRSTPSRTRPQFSAVSSGTGTPESFSYARNCPIGVRPRLVRSRMMMRPSQSSSISPAIGAPDHGLYFVFAGIEPAFARSPVSTP